MTNAKVRSTVSYWHEFRDGSDIRVSACKNGNHIAWHIKGVKDMSDSTLLEVKVSKSVVESTIPSPIGYIPCMKQIEKKEFEMTYLQYKEFIVRFWENGYEYYDQI